MIIIHVLLEGYKDYHEVYTDASKAQNGIGISIIIENQHILFKLPNSCSMYTAEALAIFEVIKIVIKKNAQNV